MTTLSIITICQDEETPIKWFLDCCKKTHERLGDSLREVIIIDGGSVDKTLNVISENIGNLPLIVIGHPFDSWGKQRNRALECCSGDYVFSPDAYMSWTNNLADVILNGNVNNNTFWNLQLYFRVLDFHHYSTIDSTGASMRLFRRGPKFITEFHESLEGQPKTPSLLPNIYLFENCLLLNDEELLNRGKRLQKFQKELSDAGAGPGAANRYVIAKQTGLNHAAHIPDSIIGLL